MAVSSLRDARACAVVAALILGCAALAGGVQAGTNAPIELAQLKLEFGVSDATVLRSLNHQGYDDIDITYRGLTKARVEACKNGVRYRMEIKPSGEIQNRDRIGDCREPIGRAAAADILRRQGFRDIRVGQTDQGFAAVACQGRLRFRVAMDRFGSIERRQELGPCGGALSREEIEAYLRSLGYDRVRVTDTRPPRLLAEACRDDNRLALRLSGNADVLDENRIGRCEPPIRADDIPALLGRRGYDRVEVIDDRPPRYRVQACRSENHVELVLDRYGDTLDERQIGRCREPLTRQELVDKLHGLGYGRIQVVTREGREYVAEVCQNGRLFRMTFTLYGATTGEQEVGDCPDAPIQDIVKRFEDTGLSQVTPVIEGCRRGARLRIELDRYGAPVETRVMGVCN